jgi:signal transduction histidine kinase
VTSYAHRADDPASLSHPHVTALCARPEEPGVLWVGTAAGGLSRLDAATGRFTRYTRRTSGLPGNTVAGVLHDDEGHLWVATNGGLARVAPDSTGSALDVRVYGVDRGVQSRQFNAGAAYRSPRGELAFGGINGFNLFTPGDFRDSPFAPRVVITDCLVEGASRVEAQGAVLMAPALDLPHDRNDLTFRFVGLHYGRPAQNRYRVRLDGHDDAWHDVGTQRVQSYANLPPGRYTFRVLASNGDGEWAPDSAAAALAVVIAPPFWDTLWFRVFGGLALVGLAATAYRWRVAQIARRNRELEALVAERTEALRAQTQALAEQHAALEAKNDELERTLAQLRTTQSQLVHAEKLASLGRLTAGVAHEIKNPLNFVNNFALLSEELTAELRAELAAAAHRPVAEAMEWLLPILDDLALNAVKIAEHGRRADGIVRAMLLHARGSAGEREPTELHGLLDESLDLAVHGAGRGGDGVPVAVERDYDPAVGVVSVNRQAVGRVVLNLLDNALYAVRERASRAGVGYAPRVVLRTRREADGAAGERVRIEVEDNGPGFSEAVRARLFEPFFTTKPTGQGTGLGLSLAHDIVRGHGGTIAVRSAEGEGAVFTVTLPSGAATAEGAD